MNAQRIQYMEAEVALGPSKLHTTVTASLLWLLAPVMAFASDGIIHNDTVWRDTGKYVIVFEADSPRQWKRHRVGFTVCDPRV